MQQPGQSTTRTTGVTATKRESCSLVSQLPIDIDQEQSINLKYEIKQTGNIERTKRLANQIGRVAGNKITIKYPISDAERLANLKLIESQFAAANTGPQCDAELVDATILSVMPYCLNQAGVSLPDDSIRAARVRALIFRKARGMKYRTDVMDYLRDHPETAQLLGFVGLDSAQIPSESTLSRTATEWGIDEQPVQNAISMLRHILFRNGILPERFAEIGLEAGKTIPNDSQLPDQLRCQGLVNYADLLLQELSDISLNRNSNVTYTPREIIATLAQLSLHGYPAKGHQLAQWHYDSNIITFSRIQQIVRAEFRRDNILLAKSSIETLDKDLHEAMFKLADDMGMLESPIDIALDPTWVPVTDNVDDTPGAISNPTISGGEGGFTYPMAVAFAPISLSLGVRYTPKKSQYPNAFRKLLSSISDFGDIGWILADREFDSAAMISLLRSTAGKQWTIRLREQHKVLTPTVRQSLDETGKAQVEIGGHVVNVFAKEYTAKHPSIDAGENMILLSDMPKADIDLSKIVEKYMNRWSVETYIRQIKHDFSPKINQERAPLNQFILTMASAFYNIWAIINQSVSPMYGLPLRPQYYDVLKAIVQSTFPRRRQFRSQITDFHR